MKLTTKGRFAVTAMIDLALHAAVTGKPVQLRDISLRQHISLPYLEQIFMALKRSGLVASVRGPGGGYRLGRDPEDITLADVIECSGEKREMMLCGGAENCDENDRCLTHDIWEGLDDCIRTYLTSLRLSDLMDDDRVAKVARRQEREFMSTVHVVARERRVAAMEAS